MSQRRPAVASAVAILLLTGACDLSTDPRGPAYLGGVYNAVSIDGRQMPTTISDDPCSNYYFRASLAFGAAYTAAPPEAREVAFLWTAQRTKCNPSVLDRPRPAGHEGTYVVRGDSLWISMPITEYQRFGFDMVGKLSADWTSIEVDEYAPTSTGPSFGYPQPGSSLRRWVFRLAPRAPASN